MHKCKINEARRLLLMWEKVIELRAKGVDIMSGRP
jgi:hypothetical protein